MNSHALSLCLSNVTVWTRNQGLEQRYQFSDREQPAVAALGAPAVTLVHRDP